MLTLTFLKEEVSRDETRLERRWLRLVSEKEDLVQEYHVRDLDRHSLSDYCSVGDLPLPIDDDHRCFD